MSSTAAHTKSKKLESKPKPKAKLSRIPKMLFISGGTILGIGLVLLLLIFFPVFKEEVKYQVVTRNQTSKVITPVDTQFGIVIPKIGANAKVIPNVNPYDPRDYQWQLTKGVAHARGTVFPGQIGNTFIFAHSAGDPIEANQFNAVFYLLYKLNTGDDINLYYKNNKFIYKVSQIKYVDASDVSFLSGEGKGKTLTLMTCWPPGTTLKRLIVLANLVP